MAENYRPLPSDGEDPENLLDDAKDYLRAAVPGWEPSDAALEVALLAAGADEDATLYALLREDGDDRFRDYGRTVLGVPEDGPLPAVATTTWTARAAAPAGGITIPAGQQLVIDATAGRFTFEVVEDHLIPEGDTTLTGVQVQATQAGADANGATGTVLFDAIPSWLDTVTVTTPGNGGSDGSTDDDYNDKVKRTAQQLNRTPVLPRHFELLAQETAVVHSALVRDGYDDDTGLSDQERTVSIYPRGFDGTAVSADAKTEIADRVLARREANWVVRVADADYTTVDAEITVVKRDSSVDDTELATLVQAAVTDGPLNPARHGSPTDGDERTWKRRVTQVTQYDVAAAARFVEGVISVDEVLLAEAGGTPADGPVALAGAAPLPLAGTITVNVIEAA